MKKTVIEQFKGNEVYINDYCLILECLKINLNIENNNNIYNAISTIDIKNFQNIQLNAKNEIIIKRDKTLIDFPLFNVEKGILNLGEENMKGKIIIDGNKDNVIASSQIIQIKDGEFSMYDNIILRNNHCKISNQPNIKHYGSALHAQSYSIINMYGGEISNNIHEIYLDKDNSSSILQKIWLLYIILIQKELEYIFLLNLILPSFKNRNF